MVLQQMLSHKDSGSDFKEANRANVDVSFLLEVGIVGVVLLEAPIALHKMSVLPRGRDWLEAIWAVKEEQHVLQVEQMNEATFVWILDFTTENRFSTLQDLVCIRQLPYRA